MARYAFEVQFLADAANAIAFRRPAADKRFDEAIITLQPIAIQIPDRFERNLIVVTLGFQFLQQLESAVFAPGKIAKTSGLGRMGRVGIAQSSDSTTASDLLANLATAGTTPLKAFSRIFASISSAISGRSLRKLRALSLPWPMRSLP